VSRPSQPGFVIAAILSFLPLLPIFWFAYSSTMSGAVTQSLAEFAITNVLSGLASVLGWTLAVAAYRRAVPVTGQYEAVFA
jgi:hypothetical protein